VVVVSDEVVGAGRWGEQGRGGGGAHLVVFVSDRIRISDLEIWSRSLDLLNGPDSSTKLL
jgi:hypothetical protein